WLDLQRTHAADPAALALAASPSLPDELWLGLSDNRIRREGARALLEGRRSWRVDLAGNPVGAWARRRIAQGSPRW
ncbi:MAG: hypothetical protein AAF211_21315, partial [Myxococcota bacterium]